MRLRHKTSGDVFEIIGEDSDGVRVKWIIYNGIAGDHPGRSCMDSFSGARLETLIPSLLKESYDVEEVSTVQDLLDKYEAPCVPGE